MGRGDLSPGLRLVFCAVAVGRRCEPGSGRLRFRLRVNPRPRTGVNWPRAEWEPSTSSGVLQFGNLGIGISGNGRQTRRAGDHSHSRFFAGGDEDEFTNAISLLLTREPRGGDLEAPSSASAGSPASRVAVASRGGPSDLSGSPRPCVRCELGCVPS